MKMVTFLAAVLFFTGLGGLSADEQITKGLTYERLVQGNWIQSQYEEAGYRIKSIFRDQDGKYRFDLEREGPLGTGYVVLEAGTVIFEAIPGTEDKLSPEMKSFLSKTGSVWESTSRFDFHEYMKLMPGNVYLLNFNRPVKAGDERMYRGVRIVVIMKGCQTNDGVKIREGPSISHKPVDLSKYGGTEAPFRWDRAGWRRAEHKRGCRVYPLCSLCSGTLPSPRPV